MGYLNSAIILMTELSSENLRNLSPNILYFGWAIGHILVAFLYFYLPYWYYIIIFFVCLPILLINFFFRPKVESIRSLVVKKKYDEAKE